MEVEARNISKTSLLVLYYKGIGGGLALLFIIFSVSSFFGGSGVKVNGNPIHGLEGLLTGLGLGAALTVIFPLVMWLLSIFSLSIFSLFSKLKITLVDANEIRR